MAVLCFKLWPLQKEDVTPVNGLAERRNASKHAHFIGEVTSVLKGTSDAATIECSIYSTYQYMYEYIRKYQPLLAKIFI
jgi:hypothetical protein